MLIAGSISAQDTGFYGLKLEYTYSAETYHPAGGIRIEGLFGKRISVAFSALYSPIDSEQYYFYTAGGQALGATFGFTLILGGKKKRAVNN